MKVIFFQHDSFVKLSVEVLSSVLKSNKHECDLFIESGEKDFIGSALKSRADLFAFSCTTGSEEWVINVAETLKKRSSTPIIVGGPHPTFFPKIIENPCIDFICRGEGEYPLLDLLDALGNNPEGLKKIQNIWYKDREGRVYENDVRPLIENLDELPFPDFVIYSKYKYIIPYSREMFPIMTSRGCPYNCSYCFNKSYKELYKNKGKYLRRRSPDNVIEELLLAREKYGIRQINFVDDSFFIFPQWLREFSVLYKEKINLPFIVNVEATQVKEELIKIIKDMGCICVRMGVETGSDYLRLNVLNKKVTSENIREAARYIKKYGINLSTYNILGIPGEKLDDAIETYKLNKEIASDFVWCSLLQPYPGTAISDYVREKGFLNDENDEPSLGNSFFVASEIKLESEKEINNLQKLMQIFIQTNASESMVRNIIKLPKNHLFSIIFKVEFLYNKMVTQKIALLPLLRLALHSLTYMREKNTSNKNPLTGG